MGYYFGPNFLQQQVIVLPERKQLRLGSELLPEANVVFNHVWLGRIFLDIAYSSNVDIELILEPANAWSRLHPIWPLSSTNFAWPPPAPLLDNEIASMMEQLKSAFGAVEIPTLSTR